jgi:succinate dehydrogenase/fumarate reductase flavoprotein subunit
MTVEHASRELECDLLVVGGGAAGLAGAVTAAYHGLKVIVAEKAPVLGGATSWSGGWMWAPLNPLSQADGIVEDIEEPRTYLKYALGEDYDEARVDALLQNARHMVAFFEKHTALQFVSGTWIADIQGDLPGAGTGGRSVGPRPRSWAWASWPDPTYRPSCTPPPPYAGSSTPGGVSRSTSST